jgi:uroporphyrinogen decarboxylase
MVQKFGKSQYIANLGHGIYPDVNPDHVAVLIDAIHKV